MKALLLTFLFIVAPVVYFAVYWWDSSQNRGYEFGYYGEFNRVKHALAGIRDITVLDSWANADFGRLEEFGFDISTNNREPIRLFFQETDPTRNLSGERLARELRNNIDEQIRGYHTLRRQIGLSL